MRTYPRSSQATSAQTKRILAPYTLNNTEVVATAVLWAGIRHPIDRVLKESDTLV
jgi:hypothetical protein